MPVMKIPTSHLGTLLSVLTVVACILGDSAKIMDVHREDVVTMIFGNKLFAHYQLEPGGYSERERYGTNKV